MTTEHIFAYTGKEIEGPLLALLERQKTKLAELDKKIAALPGAMVEAAQKPVDLRHVPHLAEGAAARVLLNERTTLLVGCRECELWLYEARRQPESVWYLSMGDLALIYADVDVLRLSA